MYNQMISCMSACFASATSVLGELSSSLSYIMCAPLGEEVSSSIVIEEQPQSIASGTFVPGENVDLLRCLGEGSWGQVWLATCHEEFMACKTPKGSNGLLHEASVLRLLPKHQNVISLNGTTHLEMGYSLLLELADTSLETALVYGELDFATKIEIAVDVARGLAHLHQHGIVHRDLASRNILLMGDRTAKIADFGVACVDGQQDGDDSLYPGRWSSPESFLYGEWSSASDVWSMGVVLWEIFTEGALPYEEEVDYSEAIVEGRLLRIPSGLPKHLKKVMRACWRREVDERPSAFGVYQALSFLRDRLNGKLVTTNEQAFQQEVEKPKIESESFEESRFEQFCRFIGKKLDAWREWLDIVV